MESAAEFDIHHTWHCMRDICRLRDRNLTEQQCKEFDGFDGRDILSLGREDFEPVVGRLKATALYNQLHPDTKESTSAREAEADQGPPPSRPTTTTTRKHPGLLGPIITTHPVFFRSPLSFLARLFVDVLSPFLSSFMLVLCWQVRLSWMQ